MVSKKRVTSREAANILNVSAQRVVQKLAANHFPNASYCECGRSLMIPVSDLKLPPPPRKKRSYGKGA